MKIRYVFAVREIDAFLCNLTAKDYFNELKEVAVRSKSFSVFIFLF